MQWVKVEGERQRFVFWTYWCIFSCFLSVFAYFCSPITTSIKWGDKQPWGIWKPDTSMACSHRKFQRCLFFVTVQYPALVFPWLPGGFRRHGLSLEIPLENLTKRNLLTRGEVTHGDIRDRLLRSTLSNYFYHMPHRQPWFVFFSIFDMVNSSYHPVVIWTAELLCTSI